MGVKVLRNSRSNLKFEGARRGK